jgi:type II restriction enzyme
MYGENAQRLYDLLVESGIVGALGTIDIELLGVKRAASDKSAVGNLIQEWLGAWMNEKEFYFREPANSQIFPDFFLSESNTEHLLEVKTFDYSANPNFDVANFDAYVRSLMTDSYRLDADYLVVGYELTDEGLKIEDIWLKKIWQLTCASNKFALRTQTKQGKIYNIRPYNFKVVSQGFQPFETRLDFVNAIKQTLADYEMRTVPDGEWFHTVSEDYRHCRGRPL